MKTNFKIFYQIKIDAFVNFLLYFSSKLQRTPKKKVSNSFSYPLTEKQKYENAPLKLISTHCDIILNYLFVQTNFSRHFWQWPVLVREHRFSGVSESRKSWLGQAYSEGHNLLPVWIRFGTCPNVPKLPTALFLFRDLRNSFVALSISFSTNKNWWYMLFRNFLFDGPHSTAPSYKWSCIFWINSFLFLTSQTSAKKE